MRENPSVQCKDARSQRWPPLLYLMTFLLSVSALSIKTSQLFWMSLYTFATVSTGLCLIQLTKVWVITRKTSAISQINLFMKHVSLKACSPKSKQISFTTFTALPWIPDFSYPIFFFFFSSEKPTFKVYRFMRRENTFFSQIYHMKTRRSIYI